MKNLSDKILNEIKSKEIKPISKTRFWLRNGAIWLIAIFSVIIGTLSVALATYNILSRDWDIYRQLGNSMAGYVVSSLPYIWIGLVIISLLIAVFNVEHSKKGYKYQPILITAVSLALSLLLGFAVYGLGGGKAIDDYLGSHFSSYHTVEANKEATWSQPSKGLFSGVILSMNNNEIQIKDFNGQLWTVDISHATIRRNVKLQINSEIKIIGSYKDSQITASEIKPWGTGAGNGYGRGRSNK